MDEISREPLPENPGQRVSKGGDRKGEPTEWDADPVGGDVVEHGAEPSPAALARGLGEAAGDGVLDGLEDEAPGRFDRQELLMALDRLPGDPEDEKEEPAAGESPAEGKAEGHQAAETEVWVDAEEVLEQELAAAEQAEAEAAEMAPEEDDPDADEEISATPDPELDTLGLEAEPTELDEAQLSRVLCGLLIAARDGSTVLRLAQATDTSPKLVRAALQHLGQTLEHSGLPLELAIEGEAVRLLTAPDVFEHIRKLKPVKKAEKLSAAALETLAVIAYRQPVIRAEIEAIRGVKAGPILKTLIDHNMVKVAGRADVPGRPLQYGTTQHFLEAFGLESIQDLPSVKEFRSL